MSLWLSIQFSSGTLLSVANKGLFDLETNVE